jgi:hypothetical protein
MAIHQLLESGNFLIFFSILAIETLQNHFFFFSLLVLISLLGEICPEKKAGENVV